MADAGPGEPEFKELPPPTRCVLWQQPGLVLDGKDRFEVLENFTDESHLTRSLLKCRECGQLYFSEFYEVVDWDDGDDAQYTTYIPVPSREQAAAMKDISVFDLMLYSPRLQWDHRTGAAGKTLSWVGKDSEGGA
jgi:hypothetical protein